MGTKEKIKQIVTTHDPVCLGCDELILNVPIGTRHDFHGKECKDRAKKRKKQLAKERTISSKERARLAMERAGRTAGGVLLPTMENVKGAALALAINKSKK